MSNPSEQDAEQLSALADGELDDASVARVCARWWHEMYRQEMNNVS